MKNYEEIKNYLLNHVDEIRDIVIEINSIDNSLNYLEYYENDEEFLTHIFIIILLKLSEVLIMEIIIIAINMFVLMDMEI